MNRLSMSNFALAALGMQRITAIDEDSDNATRIETYWDALYEEVLRMYDWPRLKKRLALSIIDSGDNDPYDYAYSLPNDCAKIISLITDDFYTVEGDTLYTGISDAVLLYVRRPDDSEDLSDNIFCQVVAYRLASVLAIDALNNSEKQKMMDQRYVAALQIAQNAQGMESKTPDRGIPFIYPDSLSGRY